MIVVITYEVVCGGGEGEDPIDECEVAVAELPQQPDRLPPLNIPFC